MTKTKHWHAGQADNGEVHIWPCQDSITHQPDDDCTCVPQIRLQQTDEGDLWIYTHQAADGRPFVAPGNDSDEAPTIPWFMRVWAPLPTIAGVAVASGVLGYVLGLRRR